MYEKKYDPGSVPKIEATSSNKGTIANVILADDPGNANKSDTYVSAEPRASLRPFSAPVSTIDFVQSERDRLRAGLLDCAPVMSAEEERVALAAQTPSPPIEHVTARDLARFQEIWLTRHQSVINASATGTGVSVDLGSGLYVMGASRLDAADRFEALFGSNRSAWSHEVRVPITIGGGLWALQSEA